MTNPAAFHAEQWLLARAISEYCDLRRVLQLRYRVYCKERGFCRAEDYPDHLEIDEYDDRSVHFAAFDPEGEVAGSVRLVCHERGSGFPYQDHCKLFNEIELPDARKSGEVSRLVLNRNFRTPPGGGNTGTVIMSVYREMYRYSLQNGIEYWYAAMERSLVRMMGRIGVEYQRIGPEVDYYGPVAPYLLELSALQERLARVNPALLHYLDSAL
ncbi:MAG: GNAT family N-acyltransferase [Chromatocurvus sp.]